MAVYTERNNTTLLSAAADADGDVLTVTKVNGQAALVGVPVPLSVGGSVTVASDGVVTFDDTGFVVPEVGEHVADSLIATISDGTTETDTSVNLELYGTLEGTPTVFGALTRAFEGGVAAPAGATSITASGSLACRCSAAAKMAGAVLRPAGSIRTGPGSIPAAISCSVTTNRKSAFVSTRGAANPFPLIRMAQA